jgi:hypothetical protein
MTVYYVQPGHTLSAHGHGNDNLMSKTIGEGSKVPQAYIDSQEALQPGRIAELVKAGVLRKEQVADPAPSKPKVYRVGKDHHLAHRQDGEPIRAGKRVPDEVLQEMGPGRVKQLVEAGVLTEHAIGEPDEEEEGGVA